MAKKILVADDNYDSRKIFELLIEDTEYDLVLASDGKIALDKYIDEQPDLVILDLFMPNMNGIQVFQEIRKRDKKVPILAFTGAVSDEDIEEANVIGFDEFIPKPIDTVGIMEYINKYIMDD
jgi:CheY-like chemotaxis protein